MFKRNLAILITFLFLVLASGCAPECTAEEIASFVPILESPPNGSEVSYDSPITFDWTHNESCRPHEYQIIIDNLGVYYVEGDTSNFDYGLGFSPGIQYEWIVRGIAKDENNHTVNGPHSEIWTFTTDGRCSSASELVQPVLTAPQFGEWLGEGQGPGPSLATIRWSYSGDCYPDSFHYQAASDPGFTNIITSGITDWNQHKANISVPRCARIHWRVQARAGNNSGEYSEPSRFTYASISSCFQNQASIDAALIRGFVFEDYCMATFPYVPEDVGISMECAFSGKFGVYGNGVRARGINGEPGMPNVVIDLGAGQCPSTGLDEFTTMSNGMYYFMVQSPGEYCVSVSKIKNPDLKNGIWTNPLTDQEVTQQTLTFGPGEMKKLQDFGWDKYDYIPVEFGIHLLSVCRAGDSTDHREIMYLEKGQIVPIIARNEDSTWFLTKFGCYVSLATGEPAQDPGDLPIYPGPPPPQPQEDPDILKSCSSYNDPGLCPTPRCKWVIAAGAPDFCTDN